jgi:hypothetical protein
MMAGSLRRFPWVIYLVVFIFIVFVAGLPVWSVITASFIAEANQCALDEGSIHPCLINGSDWGDTLYTLAVLGWLGIATIPVGLLAVAVLTIVFVIHLVVFISRKQERPTTP